MQDFSRSKKIVAIIAAGGLGVRFNAKVPKALANLNSKTIIERTLAVFLSRSDLEEIVVVCPSKFEDKFSTLLKNLDQRIVIVGGGKTRQESIFCGLQSVASRNFKHEDLFVIIHDAARCLVKNEVIDRVLEAALLHGAASAGLPVIDSLKAVDQTGLITRNVNRDSTWSVQTPQAFNFETIWQAHRYYHELGRSDFTDDTGILEGKENVYIVNGSPSNIKITCPEDITLAEAFLQIEI